MKRRSWLVVGGTVLAVMLIGAGVVFSYVQSLTALKPLGISYATVKTMMPTGTICAGSGDDSTGVAKEIINLESDVVYVAGGTNPIPDEVWIDVSFRLPLLKNSTRNLLFEGSCFFRSPDAPADCEGAACLNVAEISSYTWLALTRIAGQSCFPDVGGCAGDRVDPGYVSINTLAKCHRLVYEGRSIYELSDGDGNRYVMHATATGTPDLDPALPTDWTLREREIGEPLELLPFGGGNNCFYNVIRDNLAQSYHQYVYAGAQYPD